MHFLYLDETGDPGRWEAGAQQTASQHYGLSGVVIPASSWRAYLDELIKIRRQLKSDHGLPVREELHGVSLVNPRGNSALREIKGGRARRIEIYRSFLAQAVQRLPEAAVINVYCDKSKNQPGDVEEICWQRLLERFNPWCVKKAHAADPWKQGVVRI